jgi:hypothetical protein
VLDADFVPAPDLLVRTVPHFADPTVGMVQVRWDHLNRGPGLLTELEAVLLDGHFAVEQRARASRGAVFNFNGTAGLWRAEAITSAGGWHADTLTEDLDLSYRAALAGWRFVLVDDDGVPGELPARMPAFRTQQYRWAKGSIEVARKLGRPIAASAWPWRRRLGALLHVTHNVPYLATGALVVASAPALALAPPPAWARPLLVASAALTTLVLTAYVLVPARLLPARPRLRALVRLPALVALTCGISLGQSRAVLAGVWAPGGEFVRTPKDGVVGARKPPRTGRRHPWRGRARRRRRPARRRRADRGPRRLGRGGPPRAVRRRPAVGRRGLGVRSVGRVSVPAMKRTQILTSITLGLALTLGCGGGSKPAATAPVADPVATEAPAGGETPAATATGGQAELESLAAEVAAAEEAVAGAQSQAERDAASAKLTDAQNRHAEAKARLDAAAAPQ